jgi:hypothetical protein
MGLKSTLRRPRRGNGATSALRKIHPRPGSAVEKKALPDWSGGFSSSNDGCHKLEEGESAVPLGFIADKGHRKDATDPPPWIEEIRGTHALNKGSDPLRLKEAPHLHPPRPGTRRNKRSSPPLRTRIIFVLSFGEAPPSPRAFIISSGKILVCVCEHGQNPNYRLFFL